MTKIQVFGDGLAFVIYELTHEVAEQLTEGQLSEDEFFELLQSETLPVLAREGGVSGDFVVDVNGSRIKHGFASIEFSDEFDSEEDFSFPGKYLLVIATREKGEWFTGEVSNEFDPAKFSMNRIRYSISGQPRFLLADFNYENVLEFGETAEQGAICTVTYPDGSIYDVQYSDEDSWEDENDGEEEEVDEDTGGSSDRAYPLTATLIQWFEEQGWTERPTFNGDSSTTKFGFSVDGKFGLDCQLQVGESAGIVSLIAVPRFRVPSVKIAQIANFCAEQREDGGAFNVNEDGSIYYLHSRGITVDNFSTQDVSTMMNKLIKYVRKTADRIVEMANS